jgi:cobalt-precorrin 5A hydrolase/precorrin-3B C17-methyltransferase
MKTIREWFDSFVKEYLQRSPDEDMKENLRLKAEHTLRVVENIERLSNALNLDQEAKRLARIIAFCHDLGRFPQYLRYRTFRDAESENHAILSIEVINKSEVLEGFSEREKEILFDAVRFHNAFKVPELPEENLLFVNLIRDADKLDIWRVFSEYYQLPQELRSPGPVLGLPDTEGVSEEVLKAIKEKRIAMLKDVKNQNDFRLLQLSWVFDLNFRESFKLLKERGYVSIIGNINSRTVKEMIKEIEDYIDRRLNAKVFFVGAGPGDPELLTIKGEKVLEDADVVIYAGSLINPELLSGLKARLYDSSSMNLDEIVDLIERYYNQAKNVVRLHSGDLSIYSAMTEQIERLKKLNIPFEVIPGVSSFQAGAAILGRELTIPEVSQTVILTRLGGRTPVPEKERLRELARHNATMVIFLSACMIDRVQEELLQAYPPETPFVVIEKATWKEQRILQGELRNLAGAVKDAGINRTALIYVGNALSASAVTSPPMEESRLYSKDFEHTYRRTVTSPPKGLMTFIFYITNSGRAMAERLKGIFPSAEIIKFNKSTTVTFERKWREAKNLIFIMATGIVVRTISPFLKDKKTDPAVVVIDEKGRYVISLIGGHLGGANELAKEIARYIGAEPVITTSSDINEHTAIDLWAKEHNLVIEDPSRLPSVATRLINRGFLNIYADPGFNLEGLCPHDFIPVSDPREADLIITNRIDLKESQSQILLRPKSFIVGIGCNSGTSSIEIEEAVNKVFEKYSLSFNSIHSLATIDLKAKEKGLIDFARKHGFDILTFSPEELNRIKCLTFDTNEAVFKATGAIGVSEPAALLASGAKELLIPKQKHGNVTVAVAEINQFTHSGMLYIVGTGPGDLQYLTQRAKDAIMNSDVIVGYDTYIDLIKDIIKGKEVVSTPMTQEIERAEKAVELALAGKTVSIISGGDPGIYGMAGLVFEILKSQQLGLKIEVIPGISALNACSARLGAPLMHDFAVISLSDRLTDWELIEERLDSAAKADFITVLYNPRSKGRPEHIKKAIEIFMKYRNPETPVGIVKSAMRRDERIIISTLKALPVEEIDMQTTVIIGNSSTYIWNRWMITPRGYERKLRRCPQ